MESVFGNNIVFRKACLVTVCRVVCFAVIAAVSPVASAQDTPDYFRQNCMNCHTIGGGRLTGPDLKDPPLPFPSISLC